MTLICLDIYIYIYLSDEPSVSPSCQRDRLMANAGDLRDISRAVTSVSQELAVLVDDVRKKNIHSLRMFWKCCMFAFIMNMSV